MLSCRRGDRSLGSLDLGAPLAPKELSTALTLKLISGRSVLNTAFKRGSLLVCLGAIDDLS